MADADANGRKTLSYLLSREGDAIERPRAFAPLQEYLAEHRKGGDF